MFIYENIIFLLLKYVMMYLIYVYLLKNDLNNFIIFLQK